MIEIKEIKKDNKGVIIVIMSLLILSLTIGMVFIYLSNKNAMDCMTNPIGYITESNPSMKCDCWIQGQPFTFNKTGIYYWNRANGFEMFKLNSSR